MNQEIYVSVDIESDGPIPGPHSMLSLGAAAFTDAGDMLGTFSVNLETLPGAEGDPETMSWWAGRPSAWEASREGKVSPEEGMRSFVAWVDSLGGKPVFVGYPATFDFGFVYWYMLRFVGRSPFSFSGLDIKSYAMAKLGMSFRQTVERNFPSRWLQDLPEHTHVAVDDAIEQGLLFMAMLREA